MARLIPSESLGRLSGAVHTGEAETVQLLQKELSDEFTLYHSVHWTMEGKARTSFGEIDFIIVNQSGHVLVIEQKNGALQETDQGLVKDYGFSQKNLRSQIDRSISSIREKFSRQNPGSGLIVDYLLYCPDHALRSINGAAIDASRVVDAKARGKISSTIVGLLGPGAPSPESNRVHDFFRQTYSIVADVGAHIATSDRAYTRLAGGLLETINNLSFQPFRLRVQGVAGCGKTQVALTYLADVGDRKTLYVCYNRPLRDHMEKLASPLKGNVVETFHGLCTIALETTGEKIDFSRQAAPDFWKNIIERVVGIDLPDQFKFDRIVVDEGQDFSQDWWDVLQLFLKDNYEMLWFEDPLQNVSSRKSVAVPATVTYRANLSYRTPQSIANFISKSHQTDFRSGIPVPGLGVGVFEYSDPKDQAKMLRARVNELRRMGFKNEDIVVLTCAGLDKSILYALDEVQGARIRKFTRTFTVDHRPIYTDGTILFDSVQRFKGRQAPAVILTDVDPPPVFSAKGGPVVFTGMTRATARLEMFVRTGNPGVSAYIGAASH